eukprot:scaffold72044_cov27-Tisochrysis_lutea.AAC.3
MDTLAALDEAAAWRGGGVGAAAADPAASAVLGGNFSPIDIPVGDAPDADLDSAVARPGAEAQFSEVPEGTRLEYWWNEEWGWCAATVVGKLRPLNGKLVRSHMLIIASNCRSLPTRRVAMPSHGGRPNSRPELEESPAFPHALGACFAVRFRWLRRGLFALF